VGGKVVLAARQSDVDEQLLQPSESIFVHQKGANFKILYIF
jgi:hypothetical protein